MKGLYGCFCLVFIASIVSFGQATGDFRSAPAGGAGDWNAAASWERFDGASWVAAVASPTGLDGVISIRSGHTITITAGVIVDQTVIQSGGIVTINAGQTVTLGTGAGDDINVNSGGILNVNGTIQLVAGLPANANRLRVNGTVNNNGSFLNSSVVKFIFEANSNYFHLFDGTLVNAIPTAAWNATSTVHITGFGVGGATAPTGLAQPFGNFIWNCPNQDQFLDLAGAPAVVNGNFQIDDTGAGGFYFNQGPGANESISVGGDFIVNGGIIGFIGQTVDPGLLTISGDLILTGGYFQIAEDVDAQVDVAGDISISGSGQLDFSATSAVVDLNVEGNFSFTGGDIFVNGGVGNLNFIGTTQTVQTFTSQIAPSGAVNYSVGSLAILSVPGTNFIGGNGNFNLAGRLQLGSIAAGGALQTGTANGNLRVPTANRIYQDGSTIEYNGTTGGQFIGNGFPSGSNVNLTINNSAGVTLSSNLNIVALRTLNLTLGNLVIGTQTLTINGTVTGSGGMIGGATSNLVIGGTGDFGTLIFNGTNELLNFTINRTSSGLVTLGGNLTVLGVFTQTNGDLAVGSNTFTISGNYAPSIPGGDLVTTGSSIILINGSGTLPTDVGFSGTGLGTLTLDRAGATLSTTSSFTTTDLNLIAGTFSNGIATTIATGGTISRSGGSLTNQTTNTTNSYNVIYTSGTITSGPELPNNTTALENLSKTGSGTLTIGSNITINGDLTLSSGTFNAGSNALDIKGDFLSGAASTLTSSNITFSGTTILSGSATPTFGNVTISGTLTPSASFQINGNLVNNGTLNAGSGTTIFGGVTTISGSNISSFSSITISGTLNAPTGNFNLAGNWVNNGTFNRGLFSNTITFNGTSTVTGTTPTTFSGITISGILNAPALLNVAGSFTNNGTFNSGTGTVVFNGSTVQSISGSVVTDFNNISVLNSVGGPPEVQVQSNQNLRGVLTLAVNSEFDADGSGNTSVFTLISTDDDVTSDAAIATLPTGASVTGSVTVQRYMSIEGAPNGRIYRFISSPVSAPPVSQIQPEIPVTGTFTGASTCQGCLSSSQSMFQYTESIINDSNGDSFINLNDGFADFPVNANTETLTNGRGYTLFVRANIPPISSAGSARWDVRAPINSGPISFNSFVTFTSSGNLANDGWNFVGNPYPSTIDWDAATGWTRTGINDAIYLKDNGTNLIASYVDGIEANGGSRYIAMGQGFLVKSDGGPIDFQVNENAKVAGTSTFFFREGPVNDLLRIALKKGSLQDEIVIRFAEGATDGFDRSMDAYKYINTMPGVGDNEDDVNSFKNAILNLSSLSAGSKWAINALPKSTCSSTVSLDVSDVQPGNYSLEFSDFESFEDLVQIRLIDDFLGESINLINNPTYSFEVTSDLASFGDRFKISFSKSPIATDLAVNGQDICIGGTATVELANSENGINYFASIGGNTVSEIVSGNGSNLSIEISDQKLAVGQNNVLIMAAHPGCDAVPLEQNVTVKKEPLFEVTSVQNGTKCREGQLSLTASGAPSDGSYNWYETQDATAAIDGQHGSQFMTPVLNKTKTYYVAISNALGCEGARVEVKAEVVQFADVTVTVSEDKLISNHTQGNQWYKDGEKITGATNMELVPTESGTYTVEVSIGSCSTSAAVDFLVTSSEDPDMAGLDIYPNPAHSIVTVELRSPNRVSISLYNTVGVRLGKDIQLSETNKGTKSGQIDLTSQASGFYVIRIKDGKQIYRKKILKK